MMMNVQLSCFATPGVGDQSPGVSLFTGYMCSFK